MDDDTFSAMLEETTARLRSNPADEARQLILDHITVGLGILETVENDE